jgi:TatD DNase family protein
MLIETHTHLYAEEFDSDRTQLIEKALKNNIKKFYMPNVDSSSIEAMLALEKQYPENCFPLMGLHPCSVKSDYKNELEIVHRWLTKRLFAGIGEIGIDLYWDKTFFEEQKFAFKQQIIWALEFNYPIVIHCRNAHNEIMELLSEFNSLPKGIFHCFSGNTAQAKQILNSTPFKLGIGGVVTFKNSGLDKVVEDIDLKHLVLETDAPYLAPVPFRGKRNEPVYLMEVAKKVAEIKNCSMLELAEITSKNANEVFNTTTTSIHQINKHELS